METLINGNTFSYINIRFYIAGAIVWSCTSLSIKETQAKENVYGLGDMPVGRGRGPRQFEASCELSLTDIAAIKAASSDGRLTGIAPFTIVAHFGNPGQTPENWTLVSCEFTEDGIDAAQGDMDLKKTLPLVVGDIKYR